MDIEIVTIQTLTTVFYIEQIYFALTEGTFGSQCASNCKCQETEGNHCSHLDGSCGYELFFIYFQ